MVGGDIAAAALTELEGLVGGWVESSVGELMEGLVEGLVGVLAAGALLEG